eukprot:NODE_138_length_17968_cov_0.291175.p3 type:complete len:404 gc:universal NODE_138_length_17968_cov_0.291175:16129-17340(+)
MLRRQISIWSKVELGPADPILGISEAFFKDSNPNKINLGVGAYRDSKGKPWILPSVRQAEKLLKEADKEYDPISGSAKFCKLSQELKFGQVFDNIATTQTISGTGALRVAGEFFKAFYDKPVYLPNPSWGNHTPIFKNSGLQVQTYKYYDPSTCGLDFGGMMSNFETMANGSIVLLHACAHNPTGVDPTFQQWEEILEIMKKKQHVVLFDMAYQGFSSGDPSKDAEALRLFQKHSDKLAGLMVCQSFAKNFGLYGERVGTLSIVGKDTEEKARVMSQLKRIIRPMYSNPPIHGSKLVVSILSDPLLKKQWHEDLITMSQRIFTMRSELRKNLEDLKSELDWEHITTQIGMFCYSGLKPKEVDVLKSEYSVYLTSDGRISMAGVSKDNVQYLAYAIHRSTKSRQ